MSRFPKQKLFNRTLTIAAKQKVYEKLILIFYSCISKFTTPIGLLNFSVWTNGQHCFFGSVPISVLKPLFLKFQSTGSSTSVLVPSSQYQGFFTRVLGGNLNFTHFDSSSVPFRYHCSPKSGGTFRFGIGT